MDIDRKSIISLLFFFQATINGVNLAKAQNPLNQQHICRNTGDFKNKTLLESRDEAFNNLYASLRNTTFAGFRYAEGVKWGTKVAVTMLCPSDVKLEACEDCIKKTVPYLKQNCPTQKEAAAWTSLQTLSCMVRYASERNISKVLDDWGWVKFANQKDSANVPALEQALDTLAQKLQDVAAGGDTNKKFASGDVHFGAGSRRMEGYMQCTPDLSKEDCIKCLSKATNLTHTCCTKKGHVSGRTLSTNCHIRYLLPVVVE